MYICVCKAVRERDIHEAVRNGLHSMKQLSRELGVGTECGLCAGCARDCLREARAASHADTASLNGAAA